ncbi:MAG: phosphonoacetaldehyde hydrolase [Pseudomonadota bacterium]
MLKLGRTYEMIPDAIIFDWAGTMIDFGSIAPMQVFVDTFAEFDLSISVDQARAPMGMAKRDHIAAILGFPEVSEAFKSLHGRKHGESDVDALYEVFVPRNENVVADFATLVPGALQMLEWANSHRIRIGSTTGYTRSIMERVTPIAAGQGYEPDCIICSDEVASGRPAPDAMHKCAELLGLSDPTKVIKVDDTVPGIGEGVSFSCVTVGVSLSGNYAGKPAQELAALSQDEITAIRECATKALKEAGADHVIDTVADLPQLLEALN